jgi:hypothetical protein
MSYFKLHPTGVTNPIREYGALDNLRRIMGRDTQAFRDYINLGNRTLKNQNPLVEYLQSFSVNVEWSQDYLINEIDSRATQLASLHDFTSLYNRGKNFPLSFYPETNHNTLIVVPFGKPSLLHIDNYFSIPLNELVPLYPIYTTDKQQRWDIMDLIDTQTRKLDEETFTIIQVDPYALIIGLWRWLQRGVDWGNSPNGYLANFPLMNLYLYHNELVNFNYLNNSGFKGNVLKPAFNLESYSQQLTDYTDFKNRYLSSQSMKSFFSYMNVNKPTNTFVDAKKMIYQAAYKSLYFVQLSWVYTLASLGNVEPYIRYNNLLGTVDGQMKNDLNIYYQKVFLQPQINQIKANKWDKHFATVWERIKNIK